MQTFIKIILPTLFLLCFTTLLYAAANPSILLCSPQGAGYGWVDFPYLNELHDRGFEVDYTETLKDFTWERIRNYNVLVIYLPLDQENVDLVDKFFASGGGVLFMMTTESTPVEDINMFLEHWGAKLAGKSIVEENEQNIALMGHTSYEVRLAYTDRISSSPISKGVKQIWYPFGNPFSTMTSPLKVDDNWDVVVSASETARAGEKGESAPPIFAIRSYKKGRIALTCQWKQFSIGQGTKWIYNREVLSRGLAGRPSDFGGLLENTFRWLGQPSVKTNEVGGYVTQPERLLPPNERPEVQAQFAETFWPYDVTTLSEDRRPTYKTLYRGIIGAKSSYSTGKGSVEQYAQAARDAELDFLVFMEDFNELTPEKFDALKNDCLSFSTDSLKLFPGFTIKNNIGNHLFIFGLDATLPPENCLTSPSKKILIMQAENENGKFTGYNHPPTFNWLLGFHNSQTQVGYYDFTDSPKGMQPEDLRLFAMLALRYYKNGVLVEDMTDEYLLTAGGTIAPSPACVNEVSSPEELLAEVKNGHSLTYAQAYKLNTIFKDALRWSNQYDALNVFPSDGPLIYAWPYCHRVWNYGSESFVTGRALMPAPISITSDAGLKEVRIYNGENLYRRFILNGQKEFYQTLVLEGSVQKDLVLIAEDTNGGKAVSFATRCWKDGGRSVVFCGDHVNDCKSGGWLLARGPCDMISTWTIPLPVDVAGHTWDGGPPANLPIATFQSSRPILKSNKGIENGSRFNQVPLLEFSDEGAVAVSSRQDELFDDSLERVINPWNTFGPIGNPSKLMEYTLRYREYVTPTVGAAQTEWAGYGIRKGINACIFRGEITFKEDMTIESLELMANWYKTHQKTIRLITGNVRNPGEIELTGLAGSETIPLNRGDWFGLYSPDSISSSHIFVNRGIPLRLAVYDPTRGGNWITISAPIEGKKVRKGDTYTYELFSANVPIDVEVKTTRELVRTLRYLRDPAGLKVLRGKRLISPDIVECAPDDYAVEIVVPKPKGKTNMTLPLRVGGLNPHWSAGLYLIKGYVKRFYGTGEERYRALGIDVYGNAYIPIYVDYAEETHIVAGHPVVADERGKDIFIQVIKVADTPPAWHVSINNPTDETITTTLRQTIDLPGLDFPDTEITLHPGEYRVLQ